MSLREKNVQSVHKCLLGTHSVPRTEGSVVKPHRHGKVPALRAAEAGGWGSGPSWSSQSAEWGCPPQPPSALLCDQGPPLAPLPSKALGTLGGGRLVIPSPFLSPPCRRRPLEPVPLRVNLLARQGVTGGVCHS